MPKPPANLALRPRDALPAPPPKPRVIDTHGHHTPQYTVTQTLLGDYALHWNADFLAGRFCISDFPPEWMAYIQAAFRGPWREAAYDGPDPQFSVVLWDLSSWERTVGPFTDIPWRTWLPRNPLWSLLDVEAELFALHPRAASRLPLALPPAS